MQYAGIAIGRHLKAWQSPFGHVEPELNADLAQLPGSCERVTPLPAVAARKFESRRRREGSRTTSWS